MRNVRVGLTAAVLGAMAMMPVAGRAENFAGRVPADAVVYIQWAGTDALGPAYQGSHMKGLMDSLHLEKLIMAHMEKAHEGETDVQKQAREEVGMELATAVSKSATGVYVGPVDFSDAQKPSPKIAIFSKVGGEKAGTLAKELTKIHERQKKEGEPAFSAVVVEDFLLVTIGADVDVAKRLVGTAPADGLSSTESYGRAIGQLGTGGADSAALIYGNGEAALHIIDEASGAMGRAVMPPPQIWGKMESAFGLSELKEAAFAGNFDGAEWRSQGFIGLGDERTGVAALLDSSALPAEAYALVPSTATWASVMRFDGARFFDDMRNAAGKMDPRGQQQFDFGVQQFFAYTGVDLKKDLLASLGDAYVFYGTPDAAGKSLNNFRMATTLKDGEKAEKALGTLEGVIGAMAGQRDPATKIQFKTEALAAPNDKIMAHMMTLETFTPTWAIQGGVLYFSLSKEGVESAITEAGKHGTIMENPTFAAMAKRLGEAKMSSFNFADLPQLTPFMYDYVGKKLAERKAAGKDGDVGYELPAVGDILPHMTPSLEISWADKDGWHEKGIGPFPLANVIGPQGIIFSEKMKRERAVGKAATTTAPAVEAVP